MMDHSMSVGSSDRKGCHRQWLFLEQDSGALEYSYHIRNRPKVIDADYDMLFADAQIQPGLDSSA